ncbi:MAG: sulfatase-like hydrolase/transferase [Gemmatales bacterium]|nr:sulfatase-like hydrolase/transferase [Gemmatales bacterium]MDW8387785.1 sulfatase-like hydrolase/transferase [Gemmatales bacterium]
MILRRGAALRLALTFGLILCVCPRAFSTTNSPPNIIVIFADDLGWGDVGFNGRTEWATPHLDRLARQGTIFRRWYTAAVVCAPSRAALLTGKYTIHCGVTANNDDLPREEVTIAEALKPLGYATALIGKWHHGRPRPNETDYVHPMDQGFDEFFGYTDARHAWEHFPKELWDGRRKKPVSGYAATLLTDRAIDFVTRHRDRPFFLYLAHIIPHLYIEAPHEDVALFRCKFPERDPTRPANATYAAMITCLDREIGRLLKTLDDLQLSDSTLVVFSSDHGATFEAGNLGASWFHDSNRPFRGHKRNLWEGGIRVPGVVRWPGRIPAGKVSDEIVHMIDVFPTLLAAARGKPDPAWRVDGVNLLPCWMGLAPAPERTLFWEWRSEGYNQLAAMRGNLKLVRIGNNRAELFDVVADPAERRSVHAEHPQVLQQLERELQAWLGTETESAKQGKPAPR